MRSEPTQKALGSAEALPGAPEAARPDPQPEGAASPDEQPTTAAVEEYDILEAETEAQAEAKAEAEEKAEAEAFELFQNVVPSSATQSLWLAILQRAIQDLAIPPLNGKPCECRLREDSGPHWFRCPWYFKSEAREWFQAKSKKVGSFRYLCDLLGIKPWRLRRLAFEWAEEELARQKQELSPLARASVPNQRHGESRSEYQL